MLQLPVAMRNQYCTCGSATGAAAPMFNRMRFINSHGSRTPRMEIPQPTIPVSKKICFIVPALHSQVHFIPFRDSGLLQAVHFTYNTPENLKYKIRLQISSPVHPPSPNADAAECKDKKRSMQSITIPERDRKDIRSSPAAMLPNSNAGTIRSANFFRDSSRRSVRRSFILRIHA